MKENEIAISYIRFDGYSQITDSNGEIVGFIDKSTGEYLASVNIDVPSGSLILTPQEQQQSKRSFEV